MKPVPCDTRQCGSGSALEALVQVAPDSALALFQQGRGSEQHSLTIEVRADKRTDILSSISSDAIICDEPDVEGEARASCSFSNNQHVPVDAEKPVLIALAPQGSEPWGRERAVRITGSRCHDLLTYSKRGRYWDAKMGSLEKAQAWAKNNATANGIRAEKHVLELYNAVRAGKLVTCRLLVQPGLAQTEPALDGLDNTEKKMQHLRRDLPEIRATTSSTSKTHSRMTING